MKGRRKTGPAGELAGWCRLCLPEQSGAICPKGLCSSHCVEVCQ